MLRMVACAEGGGLVRCNERDNEASVQRTRELHGAETYQSYPQLSWHGQGQEDCELYHNPARTGRAPNSEP